jgi:hypothetical protein
MAQAVGRSRLLLIRPTKSERYGSRGMHNGAPACQNLLFQQTYMRS